MKKNFQIFLMQSIFFSIISVLYIKKMFNVLCFVVIYNVLIFNKYQCFIY